MFPLQPRTSLTLLLALALAPSLAHSHPSLKRGLDTPLEVTIHLSEATLINIYISKLICLARAGDCCQARPLSPVRGDGHPGRGQAGHGPGQEEARGRAREALERLRKAL